MQYQVTPMLLWQAGLAYDSSAVSDSDRTFDTPTDESWRLATGVTCTLDRDTELNLGYAFIWMGDMAVAQSKCR
jgi:long-chain fatty acid transport protein